MFSRLTFHKNVWIGAAVSVAGIAVMTAVGAWVVLSGAVLPDKEIIIICAAAFFGGTAGGMIAAGKDRELWQSTLSMLIVFAVMWLIALLSERTIRFDTTTITESICLFAGGIAGGIGKPNTKKHKRKARKSVGKGSGRRK